LWFATASRFAQDGMMNLPDHMIGHVIVMFFVPMGLNGSGSARSF
jgi:cytochrome c oxidase assembly factor CtaG